MALFSSFLCSSFTWSPPVIISDFIWNVLLFQCGLLFGGSEMRMTHRHEHISNTGIMASPPSDELLPHAFSARAVTVWPRHKVQLLWALGSGHTEQLKLEVHLALIQPRVGMRSTDLGLELGKVWAGQLGRKARGTALCLTPSCYVQSLMSQRVDSNKLLPHMPLVALNRHSGKYGSRTLGD